MEENRNPTKARVLVLDDDPFVREMAAHLVKKAGFEVVTAETCEEARKHLYNGSGIDLLFSDIATEGRGSQGGFDLAVELKRGGHYLFENSECPRVVFATGCLEEDISSWCKRYNIPVLHKPYRFPNLKETIKKRLDC
ncbi:response regulator [Candidatus Woesearchaeota archaeon]|nr:response regulator [Candidatus Woesearchaeota archaeon]